MGFVVSSWAQGGCALTILHKCPMTVLYIVQAGAMNTPENYAGSSCYFLIDLWTRCGQLVAYRHFKFETVIDYSMNWVRPAVRPTVAGLAKA